MHNIYASLTVWESEQVTNVIRQTEASNRQKQVL